MVTDEADASSPQKGSVLCHERLAIVGVGESICLSDRKEFGKRR